MNGYNNDIQQEQINKLKQLFPEVVTEGKIDWQKLQATLGGAGGFGGVFCFGKKVIYASMKRDTIKGDTHESKSLLYTSTK